MKRRVIIVTGVAQGIGKAIAEHFSALDDQVYGIDILDNRYTVGDIAKQEDLDSFVSYVMERESHIDVLINNAVVNTGGIQSSNYQSFDYALHVGVLAPFYLTQKFQPFMKSGSAIINMSSTRVAMSQADTESYSAVKGAVDSLTHALAVSLAGRVRVNAIAPGWIDTTESSHSKEDKHQHLVKRVGNTRDILHAIDYLIHENAGFVTGQTLTIDGGMSVQMIYHGDAGWHYHEE